MDVIADQFPILMFASLVVLLFTGLPVGFVLGGVALGFAFLAVASGDMRLGQLSLLVNRIFGGIVESQVLVAVPMFVLMGTFLERSGVAEDLLHSLQKVMRRVPGGLAVAVALVGTILAASTGIVGASVVTLSLLALPVMLERRYDPRLATGAVAASGTLGILIPPSIMLVIMGDLLSISVGRLFIGALAPGLLLSVLYLGYIIVISYLKPHLAPPPRVEDALPRGEALRNLISSLLAPLALMVLVLGSILGGWATPTEASGVGALGAFLLALVRGRLSLPIVDDIFRASLSTTGMIFFIFVGATAFSYVFRLLGGESFIIDLVLTENVDPWMVLLSLLALVFVLGFFFDWIEITLIILPIFAPIVSALDFGGHLAQGEVVYWFAVLVAVNLQTSFLTPPFGFSLFYMKGAAPPGISIRDIYKGIVPFVLLQLAVLMAIVLFPELALWLPQMAFDQ